MKRMVSALVGALVLAVVLSVAPLGAQQFGRGDDPNVTPAEVQRMFDAYALVQAQDQLKLGDEQYPQFLPRYKALQEVRRRSQMERGRIIQDLRRMSQDAKADEAQLKERIKALQDLEVRTAAETRKAYDAIDQMLDVRQQAQFRAFEELMERRKVDLVTRARQNNRPLGPNGRGPRGRQ